MVRVLVAIVLLFLSGSVLSQNNLVELSFTKPSNALYEVIDCNGWGTEKVNWNQLQLLHSGVNKESRKLICTADDGKKLWEYEYENLGSIGGLCNDGPYLSNKCLIVCRDSIEFGYIFDQNPYKKGKELVSVHRFDKSGVKDQRIITTSDFNKIASTNLTNGDVINVETVISSDTGLLFAIRVKEKKFRKCYLVKLDLNLELSIVEVISDLEFAKENTDEKNSSLRAISLRNNTLVLLHCALDKNSDLESRIFTFDVAQLELKSTVKLKLNTSELNSLIRAVGTNDYVRGNKLFTNKLEWVWWPDNLHGASVVLSSIATKFSLSSHFVTTELNEDSFIVYGFYGENKKDLAEKGIWYVVLPFSNKETKETYEISTVELKDANSVKSSEFGTSGKLNLKNQKDRLFFTYEMIKKVKRGKQFLPRVVELNF